MRKLFITTLLAVSVLRANAQRTSYSIPQKKYYQTWVYSQRRPLKLTEANITWLKTHAPESVVNALANYKYGGTIRNNEAADIIIDMISYHNRLDRLIAKR